MAVSLIGIKPIIKCVSHQSCELVYLHHDKLHPWIPDDPLTRELSLLVEYRRRLVDDKTRLTNRLQALLKQYFPQALDWAGELDTLRALEFLTRWPQTART
jgi:transposase